MGPSTTPPWRLIEPPQDDRPTSPDAVPVAPGPVAAGIEPGILRTAALIIAAVALAAGAFVMAASSSSGDGVSLDAVGGAPFDTGASARPVGSAMTDGAAVVVVEAAGAVARPGVFRLPSGSRVADLLAAAGGYGPRVDTARVDRELNLAAQLKDGDRIRVPSRDEPDATPDPVGAPDVPGAPSARIDLNRATASELDTLPGIGPVTAAKIIAAREEAPFASVDDLRTRKILGEKTFERLRDLVMVP